MPDLFSDDDDAAVLKASGDPVGRGFALAAPAGSVIYQRWERDGQARTRAWQSIAVDRIYTRENAAGKGREAPTRSSLHRVDAAALTAVGERVDCRFMLAEPAGPPGLIPSRAGRAGSHDSLAGNFPWSHLRT